MQTVVKIGRSSIAVKISAFSRRQRTGDDIKVTEGLFTYVAVDAEGKSRPVSSTPRDTQADVEP
jgi:acyl-CoA thioesterase YciA